MPPPRLPHRLHLVGKVVALSHSHCCSCTLHELLRHDHQRVLQDESNGNPASGGASSSSLPGAEPSTSSREVAVAQFAVLGAAGDTQVAANTPTPPRLPERRQRKAAAAGASSVVAKSSTPTPATTTVPIFTTLYHSMATKGLAAVKQDAESLSSFAKHFLAVKDDTEVDHAWQLHQDGAETTIKTEHEPVAVRHDSISAQQPEERRHVVDPKTKDGFKQRIFLGIPSFRDPRCARTLVDAARTAKHPERLVFAVVEENDRKPQHKNEECVPNLHPISEKEKQGLTDADRAFWRATIDAETQLRVNNNIAADSAAGAADARSHLRALYEQDEEENRAPYFLSIDASSFFTHHWDVLLVNMIEGVDENGDPLPTATTEQQMSEDGGLLPPGVLPKGFNPRKSVFTTYAINKNEPEGAGERQGEFARETVPVINQVYYIDQESIMQGVGCTIRPGTFAASRSLGGGLVAMPGKALTDVPLDTHMQGLHQGEEVLWAARLWTSGYDLYAPTYNLLAHNYDRKPGDPNDVPVLPTTAAMVENSERAKKKVKALLSGDNENNFAKESISLGFGMGTERSLDDFLHNWLNFDTEPGRAAPVGEEAKKLAQKNWTRKGSVCPDTI